MNTVHAKTILGTVGVMVGIVVGYGTGFATEVAVMMFLLFCFQIGVYGGERKWRSVFGGGEDSTKNASPFSLALLTILFSFGVVVGIVRVQLEEEEVSYVCEEVCTFDARVITSAEIKNEYQTFTVHPLGEDESVRDVHIRTPLYPEYEIGSILTLSGKVIEPNVIMPHDGEGTFDYASYLHTKNIGSEMFYPKILSVATSTKTVRENLIHIKNNFVHDIQLYVASPASSLASGMIFGESSMSKELTTTFRVAGLSHIVVLSGFNIAIIISAVLLIVSFLPLLLRVLFAMFSVSVFVLMVGGEASVIRATLMAFVSLFALIAGRPYVARQALMLSFLAIILYEPFSLLHSVSLHLSFLATAGIVYLSEDINYFFKRIPYKYLREIVVTTTAAYIATIPYTMYTFGAFSLYGFFANILVLPLVPIAMLLTFLVVVFAHISVPIAYFLGAICSVLIDMMLWVASTVEHAPYASLSHTVSLHTMVIMYIALVCGVMYLHTRKKNETRDTKQNENLSESIYF